jgi:hypothetical protein
MFHHSPLVFTPPPPRVQTQPRTPTAAPPLPEPPQIASDTSPSLPPDIPTSIPDLAAPPAPKPQQKKTVPTTVPPRPATPTPPDQPVQPPRLGQIFTPEQEREYNRTIDESLDRVRKALAVLSKKNLNPDQTEAATRITAFQKEAEQAREAHDLANAEGLARKAATLADDLLTRVP